jgi:alpha-glucosidase
VETKRLKTFISAIALLLSGAISSVAQDISSLEKIGAVSSIQKFDRGVTLNCTDNSHVQITVLAPDLIRVRTVFNTALPQREHSWAIANATWPKVNWNLREGPSSVLITTDELEVLVNRSPLLIDFRDVRTHAVINADQQPMVYDAKGLRKDLQFDPNAGNFVAAAKKFGFDEHFYGLGEKAARLDKRRSSFVNWNSDTPGYTEGKDPIYQTIPFYIGLQ